MGNEYFLHWWGGCDKIVKELYDYSNYMWFDKKQDRQKAINNLEKYIELGLMFDLEEGEMTHKRTIAKLEMEYKGNFYNLEEDFGYEYPADSVRYMFFDGNYSCDCNKSLFIQRQCDENFPELDCGDEIEITKLDIVYEQ